MVLEGRKRPVEVHMDSSKIDIKSTVIFNYIIIIIIELNELKEYLRQFKLDNDPEIKSAIEVAVMAHTGQKRSPGNLPYLKDHIYPVTANIIFRYNKSKNFKTLVIASLLHDVLEDSDIIEKFLIDKVGIKPIEIVSLVTKNQYENESGITEEERFIRNKQYLSCIHGNLDATIIKLEDRLQNIGCFDSIRVAMRSEKASRYVRETRELFIPLARTKGLKIDYVTLLENEIERVSKLLNTNEITIKKYIKTHAKELSVILSFDLLLHSRLNPNEPLREISADSFHESTMEWELSRNAKCYTIISDEKPVGLISLTSIDHVKNTAKIGYWLKSDMWGKGIMTKAFSEIIQVAKELDIKKVSASIEVNNVASIKLWDKFTPKKVFEDSMIKVMLEI